MRFHKLKMVNWCQHAGTREVTFSQGLTGLLGPNGSGKSNTLKALVFALTGEFRANDGVKTENICQAAPDGSASYVELLFEHAGTLCRVLRGLAGKRTTLDYMRTATEPAGVAVNGDKKVTEAIMGLLDTTTRILSDFVFVQQGDMFAPFDPSRTPADRTLAFQRLFGIERMEQLWELFGEALSALPATVAPDLTDVTAAYTAAAASRATAADAVTRLAGAANWVEMTAPETEIVRRYHASQQAQGAAGATRTAVQAAVAAVRQQRAARATLCGQKDVFMRALQAAAPVKAECQKVVTDADTALRVAQTYRALITQSQADAQAVERTVAAHAQAVEAQAQGMSIEQATELLTTTQAALALEERFIAQVRAAGTGACPTCGQAIGIDCQQRADLAVQNVAQLTATKAQATTQLMTAKARLSTAQQAQTHMNAAQTMARRSAEALARLGASPDAATEAAWVEAARSAQERLAQITALETQDSVVAGEIVAVERALAAEHQRLQQSWQQYRRIVAVLRAAPTLTEFQQATAALEQKRREAADYQLARANSMAAEAAERQALATLQAAQAATTVAARQNFVRNGVMAQRELLHRDNLPKIVTRWHLETLQAATNQTLQAFQAPFQLMIDSDDIGYRALFTDGRNVPMGRLSGGEKVQAALAFRIAVNARFAAKLGVLCLDEPTEWLDADNKRCLETALGCLREFSQQRGLQGVVITHEPVEHLFDHVEKFGRN